jgi:MFS transporter, DHA1 family, multidrug resistance protein
MSFVYGILYLTFEAYPISFEFDRGWSPGVVSLPFISLFVGIIIGCTTIAIFTKSWYAKRLVATKRLNPEDRLPTMIAGSIALPTGKASFPFTIPRSDISHLTVYRSLLVCMDIPSIYPLGATSYFGRLHRRWDHAHLHVRRRLHDRCVPPER